MKILINAQKELDELDKLRDNKDVDDLDIWGINSAGSLLKIAYEILAGEISAKKKNYSLAISHLKEAVKLEDKLRYDEQPTWFCPTRHNLGGILLEAGKCAEAEKIFKEDLKEIPENGWALYGLYEALLKQNNRSEAAEIERRFKEAWKYSDVDLKSSRII